MSPGKRITKQMREDHFVTGVFRSREWIEEHLNTVLIAAGAVVLVIAGIWFYISQSHGKEQDSFELLGRAETEIRNNQGQLAAIDLQKVIDDYGGTMAAKQSAFKLANLYYATNDFAKAEEAFRTYLDKFVIDDISKQSAYEGIAASLAGQSKYADAAKAFLDAAKRDTTIVTYEDNLLHAIENSIKGDDQATAKEAFGFLARKGMISDKYRTAKVLMIEKGFLAYDKGEFK
jgi:predicted negative regulator of RcsB-dependent stress response